MKEEKDILILPMRGCPVFPGICTTIEVTDQLDLDTVKYTGGETFGLLLMRDGEKRQDLTEDDFHKVGTLARVKNKINTIYGTKSLFIETLSRFRVLEMRGEDNLIHAKVETIEDPQLDDIKEKALLEILKKQIALRDDKSVLMDNLRVNASNIQEAIRLADYLVGAIVPREKQQAFLENPDPTDRIMQLLMVMYEQQSIQKLHNELEQEVSKRMDSRQREFFLREEMKVIGDEIKSLTGSDLPEGDDGILSTDARRRPSLVDRLKALNLEGEALEKVEEDLARFNSLDQMNPEYMVLRTYLETVADLPWNTYTKDKLNLEKAWKILDADHYGIKDVKDRILEFLAVRKLKDDRKGSILCLYGPPGTGKTSVGISIAKALGRQYYRFSVGGMRDESEIKGHRRTYIGSMPGQIIKGLKVTKSKNPVFVIDEIDKMTESYQGDPASALLEVLDPEQNTAFRDHYMDIPFDISGVLFIVTANSLDKIPRPLLDRMECIELGGYTSQEKLHIGKKYLVPKSLAKCGLEKNQVKYTDSILMKIAEEYAREAGVRNFEKALDKINRKIAREIVTESEKGTQAELPVKVTEELVRKYLGQPIFTEDEILKADRVGSAIGLAWNSVGGDVLAFEASAFPGKGELRLTGQLGDVMKESASIALTYIRGVVCQRGIDPKWFDTNNIHLHVPEGAVPKDGPSAGVTMATALYSLITGQVMAPDMAMTGELGLLGKVMPIGGLKEKVLAAKRNRIKTVLVPRFNRRDWEKLDDDVKEGIEFRFVGDMQEVLRNAFPNDSFAPQEAGR